MEIVNPTTHDLWQEVVRLSDTWDNKEQLGTMIAKLVHKYRHSCTKVSHNDRKERLILVGEVN